MSTTPTLREAARQALDALGVSESLLAQDKSYHHPQVLKAYNDLSAALTQAADAGAAEPVDTFPEILAESEDAEHIIIARGAVQYICSCGQWCGTFATVTPAMIDWQEHVKTGHTLPLDYLAGHADALVWAAEVAEASDPRTGDWLYDDRNDLANALRKGPEMPPAPPAQQAVAWPRDAAEVRQFMNSNCEMVEFAVDEHTPSDDDRYQLTAHDFLSAVNWWADFPHAQAAQAQQIAQDRADAVRWREVRYQLKKEFGDRWVHVVDRNTGETVERLDILNDDGHALATAMCDRLNGRAAASGAAQGDDQ